LATQVFKERSKLSLGVSRLSRPVETQPKRTGYPAAAGAMTIVSACLLIVSNLVLIIYSAALIVSSPLLSSSVSWTWWSSVAVSTMLNILSLLAGVLALARTRLLFVVFGTSVLIPPSLSNTAFALVSLARALIGAENLTMSFYAALFIAISPIVLVLSVLSLIFLAKSRQEFS
jgi:hypothetical protein